MVVGLILHEVENDLLGDYEGEFERIVPLISGEHIRKIHIRLRNFNDYETYIKAIDIDYDSEDSIFTVFFKEIR